jgi:peroxiredoxin
MFKTSFSFGLILTLAVLAGTADGILALSVKTKIGDKVADFSLKNTQGKQVSLTSQKGLKATVLIYIATGCPYSNAFNGVMESVQITYASRGVQLIGINSNKTEPFEKVVEHARQNKFSFAVLKDEGNILADRLGAQGTPEVFLLDGNLTLRYHGALGNSKNPTTDSSKANAEELKAALDALLANKPISVTETKAFGCTIKR